MEEGIGSWFHRQQSDWQSPNLNMFAAPFDFGQQNDIPNFNSPSSNLVPTNGTLHKLGSIGVPQCKVNQPSDPHGWFYCLPRFRQSFATPISNCDAQEELTAPNINHENLKSSGNGFGCSQKRFLVFDQLGDKTTLIFSSGIGTPIKGLAPSWLPNRSNMFNLTKGEAEAKRDVCNPSGPFLFSESNEQDQEDELQSNTHEDTEELDALLYSDEENGYSEDDEVTSTGHSPSTMTAHDKRELSNESGEEVASAARPAKRQKLSDEGDDVPPVIGNTKMNRCFDYDSDAESRCGNSRKQAGGELGSSRGNLKSRKEKIQKIRETISILEGIIPDGKGRDAIVVIDEAINYLRSLKDKAKALGLDNL